MWIKKELWNRLPGDKKKAIEELIGSLKTRLTPANEDEIKTRAQTVVSEAVAKRRAFDASVSGKWDSRPMTPARMMDELAKAIPSNAIVVDDAISNRAALRHYFHAAKRGDLVGVRGQAIGGGIGAPHQAGHRG